MNIQKKSKGIRITLKLRNSDKNDLYVADIPSESLKIRVTRPSGKTTEYNSIYKYPNITPTAYKTKGVKIKSSEEVIKEFDFFNLYKNKNASPIIPQAERFIFDEKGIYKVTLILLDISASEVVWMSKPLKVDWK